MNKRDKCTMPDAPDSFIEAIESGAERIRSYEHRRRHVRAVAKGIAATAAALVIASAALFALRRSYDDRHTPLSGGLPTPTTTPDPTGDPQEGIAAIAPTPTPVVTARPNPTPTPIPTFYPTPIPTSCQTSVPPVMMLTATPMPMPTPSPMPMPERTENTAANVAMRTPEPEDTTGPAAPVPDYLNGERLYGDAWFFKISTECLNTVSRTPSLECAVYRRVEGTVTAEDAARWLFGDDFTYQNFDGTEVYTGRVSDGKGGSYEVDLYRFAGEHTVAYNVDDPAKLKVEAFESREAALQQAEAWFRARLPEKYLQHPVHPGTSYFDGKAVSTMYNFCWTEQIEGVTVRGTGLRGSMYSYGPEFQLDLAFESFVPDDSVQAPKARLNAIQAIDALNWAYRQAWANAQALAGAQVPAGSGDTMYGLNDEIVAVTPIFTNIFSQKATRLDEGPYTLAWQIIAHPAAGGSEHEFLVDAATGRLWNMHDGLTDSIYTERMAADASAQ